MRTKPATTAEVETWLAVLVRYGYLHTAEPGPNGGWTVWRGRHNRAWTLHHPVLAMDFIEDILRDDHQNDERTGQ